MYQALSARSRARVLLDEPFLVLPELQFAWAAALRCQTRPRDGERGHLTCVIGPHGSGKSLLCRRALFEAARQHPRWKFGIQSGSDWLREVTAAGQGGGFSELCDAAAKLAIIVCEDLDAEPLMDEAGEVWAVWLDELLSRGLRVLVTLSSSPARCEWFPPRVISRLHGGLCAAIPAMERDSRIALVRFAARHFQQPLLDDSIQWLADRPGSTARSLWQAVEALAQQRTGDNLASVQRTLSERSAPTQPQLAVIAREVAHEFGVTVTDMRSASRQQSLRLPRQCAMYLAHDVAGLAMQEIGRFFGRRTHTSVSHSCKRLQALLPGSPTLREHVSRLRQRLSESVRQKCG